MSTKVVNSTAGAGVLRGDGIRVYGLDAELELKAQSKRDPAYEKELSHWIEQATGMKMEFPNDLIESLRSGIVLCTLINVLIPDTIKKINVRPIALMQVENIGLYLKACWKVGVPSSDLFVVSDLYSRKGIPAVLQNLASVARASHNCPAYKGPTFGIKPSNAPPAKKWEEIKIGGPVMTTDHERQMNLPEPDNGLCDNCGTKKDCFRCDHHSVANNNNSNNTPKVIVNSDNDKITKEKQDLQNKLDKLSILLKDQEDKVSQLNNKVEQQRKQQEQKEKELNDLIENQKIQLDQKQRQILTIEAQKTLNSTTQDPKAVVTPPTSVKTSPFVTSPTLYSTTNQRNSVQLTTTTTNNNTKPPNCTKCNYQNASTSKYCISCGSELSKQIIQQTTTPSFKPTTYNINNNTSVTKPTTPTITENPTNTPEYRSLQKDKDELADKVKSMLQSIKQQEETIAKLNRSLSDERQQHEKKLLEQKLQLEKQQAQLLDQKEREFKQKFASNPVPPRSTSPINNNSSNNTNSTPIVSAGLTTNEKRFTVQMNTGLRSTQVGPGTYKADSTSPVLTSTKVGTTIWPPVNSNNNINNINTTNSNNNSTTNRKEQMEIDRLQKLVEQLEKKLLEETTRSKVKDSTIKLLEDKVQTLQSRPRKPQIQNQVVVGKKRFHTLTPDTLDNRLVEDTYKCISSILFSKPIEFHEVSSLNALFKTEPGRRRFTQILRMTLKQVPNIVLSENSFEFLLYLINTTLQEMDFSKEHDLITAKVILFASSSLYRLTQNNQEEYIKDYIRNYPIWKSIKFWEDYFWTELAKRHRKRFENAIEGVDKEIVSNLLSFFGVNMIHFNVPNQEIHNFLVDMAKSNGLTENEVTIVLEFLKSNQNNKKPTTSNAKNGADYLLSPKEKKEKKSLSFLGRK